MTRKDIAKLIGLKTGLSADKVDDVMDTFFIIVGDTLSLGEDVKLTNFGKFEARLHPAGKRRNPKTGESVEVGERMGLGFKPSNSLREQVNSHYASQD